MAQTASSDRTPSMTASPGTACLGCRRRKLKCDRNKSGCSNCVKGALQCVYQAPETGIKRKRGPYNKDKSIRERHEEDLMKHLAPTAANSSSRDASNSTNLNVPAAVASHNRVQHTTSASNGNETQPLSSEGLVEDALCTLTSTPRSKRLSSTDIATQPERVKASLLADTAGSEDLNPKARTIFEYWQIYVTRVDPLVKIIHCPTVAGKILTSCDELNSLEPSYHTLILSIYYAVISSCTSSETLQRFGESQDVLLKRYGCAIEGVLTNDYGTPKLESVQALVLYIICVRRLDDGTNIRALFGLAVRMSQLIGLHEDPGERFSPFEAEYRRRLWWHLCGQESRGAEEVASRSTSIMQTHNVQLPANLEDYDLHPKVTEVPQSRIGTTGSTFMRIRFAILQMAHQIRSIKLVYVHERSHAFRSKVQAEQIRAFESLKAGLEDAYLKHLHPSRPYDWLCSRVFDGMVIKLRMMIEHPFCQTPGKDMSAEERYGILQTSVLIICDTHSLATDTRIRDWAWFFRGYVQWHSLAIVLAELGRSTTLDFARSAWTVLDPLLANWDSMYVKRKDDPAWDHVNELIQRAKDMRSQQTALTLPTPDLHQSQLTTSSNVLQPPVQQLSTPDSAGVNLDTSDLGNTDNMPPAAGLDSDYGTFDFGDIDFDAFDTVFGCTDWEFSEPLPDLDTIGTF